MREASDDVATREGGSEDNIPYEVRSTVESNQSKKVPDHSALPQSDSRTFRNLCSSRELVTKVNGTLNIAIILSRLSTRRNCALAHFISFLQRLVQCLCLSSTPSPNPEADTLSGDLVST